MPLLLTLAWTRLWQRVQAFLSQLLVSGLSHPDPELAELLARWSA